MQPRQWYLVSFLSIMNSATSLITVAELAQKPFIQQALANPTTTESVLTFFFGTDLSKDRVELEAGDPIFKRMQKLWFVQDPTYDELCQPFRDTVRATKLSPPGNTPDDRMARLILSDQLSRNIFRGQPEAYEYEGISLDVARSLAKDAALLPPPFVAFVGTALMHSESLADHETSVKFLENAAETYPDCKWWFDFELQSSLEHKAVIDQFGRYPHRNSLKGRESTAAEEAWLNDTEKLPRWAKSH